MNENDELIAAARLAQHDDRMATGALYGNLADCIDAITEQLAAARRDAKEAEAYAEELEAEVARLRLLVPRPEQTQDELVWRDHMRGVPLAALAKEFGCTKERMRYRLKKIAESKLHLTGGNDE